MCVPQGATPGEVKAMEKQVNKQFDFSSLCFARKWETPDNDLTCDTTWTIEVRKFLHPKEQWASPLSSLSLPLVA